MGDIRAAEQQPEEPDPEAPSDARAQIVIKYRHGYPLRVIADLLNTHVDHVVASLMKLNPKEELRRAIWVRRRSLGASEDIWKNHDLLYRLLDSGVSLSDTPKVLRALGIAIDLDVAGELVHIPGIPSDRMEPVPLSRSVGDRMSLLYVAGRHHGIQPDYKLALAQMSLEEMAGLRALLESSFPPERIAEFLAIAEMTKRAIQVHEIKTLSFPDYAAAAERECRRWEPFTVDASDPWPVPANTLLRRYAHGFWDEALLEVGLRVAVPSRFTEDELVQALDDFNEECIGFEHPMTVEMYDRWVFSESSMRNDRPSAMEIIRRYGSWASALKVIPTQVDNDRPGPSKNEVHYVDYDSGWGTLEELEDWEQGQDNEWLAAKKLIGALLGAMSINSFVHIQYGQPGVGHAAPYARAVPGSGGVWCEIVSDAGLSPGQWRLSAHRLSADGWSAPSPDVPNWHRAGVPSGDAAAQILDGIRFGRHPVEATELRWSVGRVPDSPGPARGVTLQDALGGTVQSLRNAAQQ